MKKTITGFERYSVDECGNVSNNITGTMLKTRLSTNGYLRVGLRTGTVEYERPKTLNIHRLVAEHFIPRVQGKEQVNHKDGNKLNNHIDNLEWATNSENIRHAYANGLYPEKRKKFNLSEQGRLLRESKEYKDKMRNKNASVGNTKPVIQVTLAGEFVAEYQNCVVAARTLFDTQFNLKDRLIARCARGKAKSAYGFIWHYAQEAMYPL